MRKEGRSVSEPEEGKCSRTAESNVRSQSFAILL
jgi:hypothetical protein